MSRKVKSIEDKLKHVFVTLVSSEKWQIYQHIWFDKESGLPVRQDIVSEDPNFKGLMESTRTQWLRAPNGAFLPHKVVVNTNLGKPSKPTSQKERIITTHWVFGKAFPDSVFDTKSLVPSVDVRASILDNAAKLR